MENFSHSVQRRHQIVVISVEVAYQLSSVVKLTHHETGWDWPIPINPFLPLGAQSAKGGPVQGGHGVC